MPLKYLKYKELYMNLDERTYTCAYKIYETSTFIIESVFSSILSSTCLSIVGPKAYHPSFDDDQLMKFWLLMILCLISDRFIIKILVGA